MALQRAHQVGLQQGREENFPFIWGCCELCNWVVTESTWPSESPGKHWEGLTRRDCSGQSFKVCPISHCAYRQTLLQCEILNP